MDPLTMAIIAGGLSAAGGALSKNKKSVYTPIPYSGYRPPRIDYGDKQYLRPTQDLTQNIITNRAQGIDVGYDPARRSAQEELIRSTLKRQSQDDMRSAAGRLSASGLSGNARASEALAGRVERDYGRTLGDELLKISIEDLTRANEERDTNTARLQRLNETNFGQENTAANFDKDIWMSEQANDQAAVNIRNGAKQSGGFGGILNDAIGAGLGAFSALSGGDGGAMNIIMGPETASASSLAQRNTGTGINPGAYGQYSTLSNDPYAKQRLGRRTTF